jgi:geranyl-CoA carboxylase beta subunit
MIQAITNANVPQLTVFCGASFGAGHYAMCGRAFKPRFCFSWPNAKTAVMGPEQAADTMVTVTRAKLERAGKEVDEARMKALRDQIIDNFEKQMDVFATSGRLLDDGVIDPRDTRAVLSLALDVCAKERRRTLRPVQFSVARP